MRAAGCLECHGQKGKVTYFENDWVNLQRPELSRILRAPLAENVRLELKKAGHLPINRAGNPHPQDRFELNLTLL